MTETTLTNAKPSISIKTHTKDILQPGLFIVYAQRAGGKTTVLKKLLHSLSHLYERLFIFRDEAGLPAPYDEFHENCFPRSTSVNEFDLHSVLHWNQTKTKTKTKKRDERQRERQRPNILVFDDADAGFCALYKDLCRDAKLNNLAIFVTIQHWLNVPLSFRRTSSVIFPGLFKHSMINIRKITEDLNLSIDQLQNFDRPMLWQAGVVSTLVFTNPYDFVTKTQTQWEDAIRDATQFRHELVHYVILPYFSIPKCCDACFHSLIS